MGVLISLRADLHGQMGVLLTTAMHTSGDARESVRAHALTRTPFQQPVVTGRPPCLGAVLNVQVNKMSLGPTGREGKAERTGVG